jgi:uncharacterized protein YeaO (DUF488 family)
MKKTTELDTLAPKKVKSASHEIYLRRAYDPPSGKDGFRCLVDHLWPRGLRKEELVFNEWLKDVAPSQPLRMWFAHDADKFKEFRRRYRIELVDNPSAWEHLLTIIKNENITLVYAARDPQLNHAAVLKEFLDEKRKSSRKK